jgi:hypothetical protein
MMENASMIEAFLCGGGEAAGKLGQSFIDQLACFRHTHTAASPDIQFITNFAEAISTIFYRLFNGFISHGTT